MWNNHKVWNGQTPVCPCRTLLLMVGGWLRETGSKGLCVESKCIAVIALSWDLLTVRIVYHHNFLISSSILQIDSNPQREHEYEITPVSTVIAKKCKVHHRQSICVCRSKTVSRWNRPWRPLKPSTVQCLPPCPLLSWHDLKGRTQWPCVAAAAVTLTSNEHTQQWLWMCQSRQLFEPRLLPELARKTARGQLVPFFSFSFYRPRTICRGYRPTLNDLRANSCAARFI